MREAIVTPARRDRRPLALLLALTVVLVVGALIAWLPDYRRPLTLAAKPPAPTAPTATEPPATEPPATEPPATEPPATERPGPIDAQQLAVKRELDQVFEQGAALLHARAYEGALVAFNRVVHIAPRLPEAYVNMGYALLGLERYSQAERAFSYATELRPDLPNAYYGLALVFEQQGDLQSAMGAMRTFVHRTREDDPYLPRARAALWEWEQSRSSIRNEPAVGKRPGSTLNDEG